MYDDDNPPAGPRRPGRTKIALTVAAVVLAALAAPPLLELTGGSPGSGAPEAGAASGGPAARGKSGDSAAPDDPGTRGRSGASPSAAPLAGKVVVIDPGHNPGNFDHPREISRSVDIGTNRKECDTTGTATQDGYTEAEFTLDVSRRLRALLREQGATVTFTQDADRPYGPCVDERARIGNAAGADAVVSVHADGAPAGSRGFHVILPAPVTGGAADTSAITGPSRALGEHVAEKFALATGSAPSDYIGGGTGLDVRGDLGGLNLSTVPKVFVECGNMRDPKDAALLKDMTWRQKAARGIADGISTYLLR